MPTFKCNACGGTFVDPQGQFRYFHTCPTLGVAEVIAAHDAGTLGDDPILAADVLAAKTMPEGDPSKPNDGDRARARLVERRIKRPGHVDQNLKPSKPRSIEDPPPEQISPGAGVTQIGA